MNLAAALGVSLAALTVAASATPHSRVFIRHGGPEANIDVNEDGWITRAEASTAFERIFDDMDSNDDGRLTGDDRPAGFDMRIGRGEGALALDGEDCTQTVEPQNGEAPSAGRTVERRVTVICRRGDGSTEHSERRLTILRGGDALSPEEHARIQREIDEAMRGAEWASRDAERAEREAERLEEQAERLAERVERQVHREVIVIDGEDGLVLGAPPVPGLAPMPPHPPMFMMLFASSNEADSNADGTLSREEFRAQHLRFFDASDVNGDGRVQFERPPSPPEAPQAPRPPQ